MPDVMVHTAAAFLARRRAWDTSLIILFLFGAMLPDLVSRPFYYFFPEIEMFFIAMHTPLVVILFCILLSQFFQDGFRTKVFLILFTGSLTHQLLDLFQIGYSLNGYMWLFPFDDKNYYIGLYWPEDPLYAIPFLLAAVCIDLFFTYRKNNKVNHLKG